MISKCDVSVRVNGNVAYCVQPVRCVRHISLYQDSVKEIWEFSLVAHSDQWGRKDDKGKASGVRPLHSSVHMGCINL